MTENNYSQDQPMPGFAKGCIAFGITVVIVCIIMFVKLSS